MLANETDYQRDYQNLPETFELASVAEEDLEHSFKLKELVSVLHQQRLLLHLGPGL
jgi:hypothetical protein